MQIRFQSRRRLMNAGMAFSLLILTACSHVASKDEHVQGIVSTDRETANLADVTADALQMADQLGKQNVLVVFDIDNTLLAMEQGLGSDQWYEWQKQLSNDDHCNPDNVGNRFAAQGAIYFASAMRPTQTDASKQVKLIQDQDIPVIALTSRGEDYRLQTFRELRRNGFDFSFSGIGPAGGYAESFLPVDEGRLSRYEDGIFLTAGQHKGAMLYALLQKTGTPMPELVIMADDKQNNLDALKETFTALNVPVHAWRVTSEDQNVSDFDERLAAQQWADIEPSLRVVQKVLGADNYDLTSVKLADDCQQEGSHE